MKAITQESLRDLLHYEPESGMFVWRKSRGPVRAGQRAGHLEKDGYRRIQVGGRAYPEHWLAWLYMHGALPEDELDHRNLGKADNRISNLRPANKSQQQGNTPLNSRNTHGAKGIKWRADCSKWRAQIRVNQKAISLGNFETKDGAIAAYDAAAKRFFGDFARSA